jgi:Flp pilus assembly protein TadD
MADDDLTRLIGKGIASVEQGNSLMALVHFEDAAKLRKTPIGCSYLAYCLAKERRQMTNAVSLCLEAMQQEPGNAVHYLNLGRIYLLAGQKANAIQVFRKGLKFGKNQQIIDELKKLGLRKLPVLGSLPRKHPLNKYLGILSKKLGMR